MKNLLHIVLSAILSSFIICGPLQGQTIRKYGNNQFEYKGEIYNYKNMASVFSQNETAYTYYIKANRKLKTSKGFGFAALGSTAVGIISLATIKEPESCSRAPENFGQLFFGGLSCGLESAAAYIFPAFMLGIVTPILGITALIIGNKGRKNKRTSIDSFNREYGIDLPRERPVNVELLVGNGLSLQIKF